MDVNKDIQSSAGEKGLSQLILLFPSSYWKMIKTKMFEKIRAAPESIMPDEKSVDEESKVLLRQFIDIEIICEAVSYSELLGAYLLAFSKEEKIIQKVLLTYQVSDVEKLFDKVVSMNEEEISQLIGYPLVSQLDSPDNPATVEEYKESCKNIQKVLVKIANFYTENKQMYNDYKHGFRIIPTTSADDPFNGITIQIVKGDILNQATIYTTKVLKERAEKASKISERIFHVLEMLIPVFSDCHLYDKKEFTLSLFKDIESEVYDKEQHENESHGAASGGN